jgi:hypothetical protein
VLEVGHSAVPLPINGDPLPGHLGSVFGLGGVSVEFVAPHTSGRASLTHVNGISVELSVTETVASQEVVLRGSRSVFHQSLATDIYAVRDNVLGPDVVLAVGACAVLVLAGLVDCGVAREVAVVPRHGDHDVIGALRVDLDTLLEATLTEGTNGAVDLVLNVNDVGLECKEEQRGLKRGMQM